MNHLLRYALLDVSERLTIMENEHRQLSNKKSLASSKAFKDELDGLGETLEKESAAFACSADIIRRLNELVKGYNHLIQ